MFPENKIENGSKNWNQNQNPINGGGHRSSTSSLEWGAHLIRQELFSFTFRIETHNLSYTQTISEKEIEHQNFIFKESKKRRGGEGGFQQR